MSEFFDENTEKRDDNVNNAFVNEQNGERTQNAAENQSNQTNPNSAWVGNQQHSYTWSNTGARNSFDYGTDRNNDNYATPVYGDKNRKKGKAGKGGLIVLSIMLGIVLLIGASVGGAYVALNYINADGNGPAIDTSDKIDDAEPNSSVNADRTELEPATIVKSESQPREVLDGTVAAATQKAYKTVVAITTETVQYNTYYGQYITDGAGSGVIISDNGYIITCAHVVDGASTITVTLSDGTVYDAKLVGSDVQTDIAVIKIDAAGLDFAVIGNSDNLVIGEVAIAIGNPLGTLGGTVTSGIISALDREISIDKTTYKLLQTSAAINPGNSGGGLFNIDGELIGVVNAKSSGDQIEGLGFAIPINNGMEIANQLIENGYIKDRAMLGIKYVEVAEYSDLYKIRSQYPDLLNYITDYGVYVIEWKNGDFKFGDRIIAVNGTTVTNGSEIKSVLLELSVGDKISVTVSRLNDKNQSRMVSFDVTLSENVPE